AGPLIHRALSESRLSGKRSKTVKNGRKTVGIPGSPRRRTNRGGPAARCTQRVVPTGPLLQRQGGEPPAASGFSFEKHERNILYPYNTVKNIIRTSNAASSGRRRSRSGPAGGRAWPSPAAGSG